MAVNVVLERFPCLLNLVIKVVNFTTVKAVFLTML